MPDKRCFVQFSHPGKEHGPATGCDWHKSKYDHRRKFMQLRGKWIEKDGSRGEGNLWAWGEWEPESDLICDFNPSTTDSPFPRYLWKPYYKPKSNYCGFHNTDPFIFGKCFLYSNCRQSSSRSLKQLARGSVIAFGSKVRRESKWALDTVLVVKDSIPYDPRDPRKALKSKVPEPFLNVTGGPLAADRKLADKPELDGFRLYRGATPDNPVHGMFSFFPATTAVGDSGFPRPLIDDLPDNRINPRSFRAPKGQTSHLSLYELFDLWSSLIEQVHRNRLVLGIYAALPPKRRGK